MSRSATDVTMCDSTLRGSCGIFMDIGSQDEKFRASRVFEELIRAFRENVPLGRHIRRFKIYNDCFVASEAVTWFLKQLQATTVKFFAAIPNRQQVVRILAMFYERWVHVFTDIRGEQYDLLKPVFTDSRRLFRLNPDFKLPEMRLLADNYMDGQPIDPEPSIMLTHRRSESAIAPTRIIETCDSVESINTLPLAVEPATLRKTCSEPSMAMLGRRRGTCNFRERVRRGVRRETDDANASIREKTENRFDGPSVRVHRGRRRRRADVTDQFNFQQPRLPLADCGSLLNSAVDGESSALPSATDSRIETLKEFSALHEELEKDCFDVVVTRLQSLLEVGNISEVFDVNCISDATITANLLDQNYSNRDLVADSVWRPSWFVDTMEYLSCYEGCVGDVSGCVDDLMKLVCDYCLTWREPLFTYRLSGIIVSCVETLLSRANNNRSTFCFCEEHTISLSELPGWRHPSQLVAGSSGFSGSAVVSTNKASNQSRIVSTTRDESSVAMDVEGLIEQLRSETQAAAPPAFGRQTVPYFPAVSSSLREARKMFGSSDMILHCCDDDAEYSDDTEFPSPRYLLAEFSGGCHHHKAETLSRGSSATQTNFRGGATCGEVPAALHSSMLGSASRHVDLMPSYLSSCRLCCKRGLLTASNWQSCPNVNGPAFNTDAVKVAPYYVTDAGSTSSRPLNAVPTHLLTEVLQLCCLSLPTEARHKVALFLGFLRRLVGNDCLILDRRRSNRQLIVHVFTKFIIGCHDDEQVNDQVASEIMDFLLDNQEKIFEIPQTVAEHIDRIVRIWKKAFQEQDRTGVEMKQGRVGGGAVTVQAASPKPVCFCERVSQDEYEQQKRDIAQEALLELLNNIVDDVKLTPTTKRRLLQQFQLSYPALYSSRCLETPALCDSTTVASDDTASRALRLFRSAKSPGQQLMKRSLTRLRSLRL